MDYPRFLRWERQESGGQFLSAGCWRMRRGLRIILSVNAKVGSLQDKNKKTGCVRRTQDTKERCPIHIMDIFITERQKKGTSVRIGAFFSVYNTFGNQIGLPFLSLIFFQKQVRKWIVVFLTFKEEKNIQKYKKKRFNTSAIQASNLI